MSTEKTPPWLQKVQEESWQAEILLSGIILYSLFQLPDLASNLIDKISQVYYYQIATEDFKAILKTAIQWLIIGFILHLFLRGIWIAFVGLSHIFPKGIDYENLKFSKRFDRKIKTIQSPQQQVTKLENICSGIFSISFFFFMVTAGLVLFNLVFNYWTFQLIYWAGLHEIPFIRWIISGPLIVLMFIYFVDFLSLGFIKRIKFLAPVYYPVYVLFNWFTLAFLYRGIYYAFVSNFKKVYIIIALLLFSFFSVIFFFNNFEFDNELSRVKYFVITYENSYLNHHYDDLRKPGKLVKVLSISSDQIKSNYLKLFITYQLYLEERILELHPKDSLPDKRGLRGDFILDEFQKHSRVAFNDGPELSMDLLLTWHPQTNQQGMVAWLDISDLPNGRNKLTL